MSTITVKGRTLNQEKLRAFIDSIDIEDCYDENRKVWRSPITGENFLTKAQLSGHIGAYLRTPSRKDPTEPTRAGYIRALRAGLEPTDEQRAAHAAYAAKQRRSRRLDQIEEPEPERLNVSFEN